MQYDATIAEDILEQVCNGKTLNQSVEKYKNLDEGDIYRWLQTNASFEARYLKAFGISCLNDYKKVLKDTSLPLKEREFRAVTLRKLIRLLGLNKLIT